ncbi:hypothetical protein IFM89_027790 [Coptis chinensis]|uniref:Uncharacterized protein n=1 Tax=Coptis chinensis TaxID=261450 RepID=A0A835J0Z5_9MAGN|nr:hypothetical protein IFM89_027790 [Coptis chinensis]
MEFLDEESRPKLLFQSRFSSNPSPTPQKINKPITFFCISISILLSLLTFFFLSSETITFHLLLWFSISLFLGPFAPVSITGGDVRVGQGEILEEPVEFDEHLKKQTVPSRRKFRKPEELVTPGLVIEKKEEVGGDCNGEKVGKEEEKDLIFEEKEWTDGDFDMLKKQIGKYPIGTVRRWEMIAQVFKGRHGVESVIKMGKSWNEKKPGGGDSFTQFLKQRKPLDKRMEEGSNGSNGKKESEGDEWSSGEDIALLNALKAFPKDVSMRWEKIAAAVPSKTKASCVKRVAELKKGFRSSKASAE